MTRVDIGSAARQALAGSRTIFTGTGIWIIVFGAASAVYAVLATTGLVGGLAGYAIVWAAISGWSVAMFRFLLPIGVTGRFQQDVGRVFAATGLVHLVYGLMVFILVLFLVIFSVILVVVSGVTPSGSDSADVSKSIAALQQSGAIWLIYAVMLAASGVFVWFGLRLILFAAATATRGRVLVFQTWPLTKGSVLPIGALAALFIAAPIGGALYLGDVTAASLGLSKLASQSDPAVSGVVQTEVYPQLGLLKFLQTLYFAPAIVLTNSLAATLYKTLRGQVRSTSPGEAD